MKLKSAKLSDVTLVSIETRSRNRMLRVDIGNSQLGLVEKLRGDRTEIHPWKAFRGLGVKCMYIGAFFAEDGGIEAAVAAVVGRTL